MPLAEKFLSLKMLKGTHCNSRVLMKLLNSRLSSRSSTRCSTRCSTRSSPMQNVKHLTYVIMPPISCATPTAEHA